MTRKKHGQTAVQKAFATYTRMISSEFILVFGPSYSTQAEIRNEWRTLAKYRPEARTFLIDRTRVFIAILDPTDSNSTNLQFLHALIKNISDYLAKYAMRDPRFKTRHQARDDMMRQLYDNSTHIRYLEHQQSLRQAKKSMPRPKSDKITLAQATAKYKEMKKNNFTRPDDQHTK